MGTKCLNCGHKTNAYDWFIGITTDKDINKYLENNIKHIQLGGYIPQIFRPTNERPNHWCVATSLYCEICDRPDIDYFVEKVKQDINPTEIYVEYA